MAGEINFGLLDPNAPGKIATSFIQGNQLGQQMRAQELQNQVTEAQYQNMLAKQEAYKAAGGDMNKLAQELTNRGMGEEALKLRKDIREEKKLGMDLDLKSAELHRSQLNNLAGDPSDANLIKYYQNGIASGQFTPEQAQQSWSQMQGKSLEQRQQILLPQAMTMDKYMTHLNQQEQLKVSKANLGVAQGHLALAQQNMVSPEEQAVIGKAILEGRLDPNRVNSRNRSLIAKTLMTDPNANLQQLGENAASGMASNRAIGTQQANVSMAANEASKMIDIAQGYSDKVDRTQYPSINAIENAVKKGTGDTNIVQLNTALNGLVNSYARAINPKGAATVSDKNHAREIVNAAYSNGQLGAIFNVMQNEMGAALQSGEAARKSLRGGKTELSGEDKAAADWAKANPGNPKAAKILQHLGL